jgi:hypothetical protein
MDQTYYPIRYRFGWFFKRFWVSFGQTALKLLDSNKEKYIEIAYKDINHIYKIPFSIDQILIFCEEDLLKKFSRKDLDWFPPAPLLAGNLYYFSLYSWKRNELIKLFQNHGVKTSVDPLELKKLWEKSTKVQK